MPTCYLITCARVITLEYCVYMFDKQHMLNATRVLICYDGKKKSLYISMLTMEDIKCPDIKRAFLTSYCIHNLHDISKISGT